MRSLWEDDEAAGMLYKDIEGDFIAEARINSLKVLTGIICRIRDFSRVELL